MVSIIDLLRSDGCEPKWVANTSGGEYAGPCPRCGGKDRFRTWPNQGDGGKWWCRKCGKAGDMAKYLEWFHGKKSPDACAFATSTKKGMRYPNRRESQVARKNPWEPRESPEPDLLWQSEATGVINWAEKWLWREKYLHVRQWLQNERELCGATIKHAHLGWNSEDLYYDRQTWGLPQKLKEDGSPTNLWIPKGLLIPCFRGNNICRLRVRRPAPIVDPRYMVIPGGNSAPMILGEGQYCIVVESELDALLLYQEASDLAMVMALGNAQTKPDIIATNILTSTRKILVALDGDEAGRINAWQWWLQYFQNAMRLPPLHGKDPTEMLRAGVNLRSWVEKGIEI